MRKRETKWNWLIKNAERISEWKTVALLCDCLKIYVKQFSINSVFAYFCRKPCGFTGAYSFLIFLGGKLFCLTNSSFHVFFSSNTKSFLCEYKNINFKLIRLTKIYSLKKKFNTFLISKMLFSCMKREVQLFIQANKPSQPVI